MALDRKGTLAGQRRLGRRLQWVGAAVGGARPLGLDRTWPPSGAQAGENVVSGLKQHESKLGGRGISCSWGVMPLTKALWFPRVGGGLGLGLGPPASTRRR